MKNDARLPPCQRICITGPGFRAHRPSTGDPSVYMSAAQLASELKGSVANHNDPALATLGVTPQYAIHEVHREKTRPTGRA
jgi:hypothetical protein